MLIFIFAQELISGPCVTILNMNTENIKFYQTQIGKNKFISLLLKISLII